MVAKYLGVYLDEMLTFGAHVEHLQKKIAQKIGALQRAFHSMDQESRRTYYVSLVQSELEYASNCFLCNLSVYNETLLIKLSKKAIRAVFGLPPWSSSAPLFAKLNLWPLYS